MKAPISRTQVLVLFTGLLAGCADTSVVVIDEAYVPPDIVGMPYPIDPYCSIRIGQLQDDRLAPTELGQMGARPVHAPADTRAWLRSVLGGLASYGVGIKTEADSEAAIVVNAELKKAWVSTVTTAKTASIVLNLQYVYPGTETKSIDYRGSISELNWVNGAGEIRGTINDAFTQILQQASVDIRQDCSKIQLTVSPQT